jgi:hypothetical protein
MAGTLKLCACGCGFMTKSTWAPGHDAKHKSVLLQRMKAGDEDAMNELINRGWMRGLRQDVHHYTQAVELPPAPVETEDDRIMDRVAKILALKANAGTAEEAEAAASMAQKMAFKYNLDLDAIEEGRTNNRTGTRNVVRGRLELGNSAPYLVDLIDAIAQNNFCKVVLHGTSTRISIVGERHNILICDYLYAYLRREIDQLAARGWEVAKMTAYSSAQPWKKSFRLGAVHGVSTALGRQRKADVIEAGGAGTALVVRKDQELNDALAEIFPYLGTAKVRKIRVGEGYSEGVAAGRNINIRRGVEHGSKVAGALSGGR